MTFRIFEQSYYSYSMLRSEREDHKLLGIIATCSNRSLSHSFRYGQERFLGRAIPVYLNVLFKHGCHMFGKFIKVRDKPPRPPLLDEPSFLRKFILLNKY
jgi:hypothetical protein